MRARTSKGRTAPLVAASEGHGPRYRLAAGLGVLALVLASAAACSAPNSGSGNATAPAGTAPASAATGRGQASAGGSGTQPSVDAATLEAKAKVEAALKSTVEGERQPGTEQIRAALAGAGLPAAAVEVTPSRTPTGLEAGAVEAAVREGRSCIIAQLRKGSVVVSVLPALAEGGCLVGAPG